MTYKTGHAIGLTSPSGTEYLIHIGIDTVNMNGDGFKVMVTKGQDVQKGDPLVQVDFAKIKAAGYDPTVLLISLNTADDALTFTTKQKVTIDDPVFSLADMRKSN